MKHFRTKILNDYPLLNSNWKTDLPRPSQTAKAKCYEGDDVFAFVVARTNFQLLNYKLIKKLLVYTQL